MSPARKANLANKERTPRSPKSAPAVVMGGVIGLAIFVVIAGLLFFLRSAPSTRSEHPYQHVAKSKTNVVSTGKDAESRGQNAILVDDDGQTLWVSPTNGPPLAVAYLPPGCQIIIAVRLTELFQHPEGVKLTNALAPELPPVLEMLGSDLGISLSVNEPQFPTRMLFGLQFDDPGVLSMTRVVYHDSKNKQQFNEPEAFYSTLAAAKHGELSYATKGELAYYLPKAPHDDRIVVAPKTAIADILDLAGEPPPLRRDMERLLAHTDGDRLVTIVFTCNALFGEGTSLFTGPLSRLRQSLFWFLGDEFSAATVSLHWGDHCFIEMVATPTLDTPPERAARMISQRWSEVPARVEDYIERLAPHPHGGRVLARFPAMLRTMVAYTRSGIENNNVVLRCYLPAKAGHNLLAAAELTLAEVPPAADMASSREMSMAETRPVTVNVRERLKRRTSLRFPRDTLEAALEQLGQDIGVTIRIRGSDLQAEGITKNQSFGIDIQDKSAEEILVEILRLANPDKSATSAADARQKLVYVISRPDTAKEEEIVVTTRAAAIARGEDLPETFIAQ